jgi:hypothetical protein
MRSGKTTACSVANLVCAIDDEEALLNEVMPERVDVSRCWGDLGECPAQLEY